MFIFNENRNWGRKIIRQRTAQCMSSLWHTEAEWPSQKLGESPAWPLCAIGSYFLDASSVSTWSVVRKYSRVPINRCSFNLGSALSKISCRKVVYAVSSKTRARSSVQSRRNSVMTHVPWVPGMLCCQQNLTPAVLPNVSRLFQLRWSFAFVHLVTLVQALGGKWKRVVFLDMKMNAIKRLYQGETIKRWLVTSSLVKWL
jgi:hypothetical protein